MSEEDKELEAAAVSEKSSETATSARPDAPVELGNERRVQFAFVALLVALVLLLDRVTRAVSDELTQRLDLSQLDPKVATAIGIVLAIGVTVALYKNKSVHTFAHDVAGELARVKWPNREETMSNTVVVIVTSLVAAVVIFAFDSIWAGITDLIYKV